MVNGSNFNGFDLQTNGYSQRLGGIESFWPLWLTSEVKIKNWPTLANKKYWFITICYFNWQPSYNKKIPIRDIFCLNFNFSIGYKWKT